MTESATPNRVPSPVSASSVGLSGDTGASRRDFLKSGTVASVAAGLSLGFQTRAFAGGSDLLRIGLVGCGGRGTGAAREAMGADPNVKLVAMADVFPEAIDASISNLKSQMDVADKVSVKDDHKFIGLHAFENLIQAVDVVVLASPPGFRPQHLRRAVEAGKHVFTEKPMATDAPGCRSVMESVKIAKEKNLALVAGFCWRYDYAKRAFFEKIHSGAIGDVQAVYGTYLTGPVKPMPQGAVRPEGMSDLEWYTRNWYSFTCLSGDGLVEQAIHTVDWVMWTKKDAPPLQCTAVGGRQVPNHGGNIYDHIEVNYEWEDGTRGFVAQRQIPGCHNENSLYVLGTKGQGTMNGRGVSIKGETEWRYKGPGNNMYQTEHDEMMASIRAGKPINDGDRMVSSTLAGIMGRMAGYTGQQVTYEMAMNSQEVLVPEIDDWNTPMPPQTMALPGLTPFI